jgi:glycosyltransferase involved in cell wall biosynthesis
MRVGFDARWYNDSGVGTYVAELLKAVASLQADLELIIYENPGNPVPGLLAGGLKRIPVRARKYSPLSHIEFRRRAREDSLDLFHSPFYPIPLGLPCPVVVTLHDLIPFLFPLGSGLKRFLIQRGYRTAARRSSHIIVVSQHTAADVQRILRASPEKIAAIHNAASAEHFHPQGTAGEAAQLSQRFSLHKPYILVASAWNWETKNLTTALRALIFAQQSGVEFQTVVYGPPEGFNAAGGREKWKELDLVETGHLPAAELGAVFRHAQLFLFPSLYEGFGLPVLEAMSCGCAVITSNAGSLQEVAGDGAQVFDPLDCEGMARATTTLLRNPIELTRWRERGLRRAADFSWARTAQATLRVYHQALADKRTDAETPTHREAQP